MINDNKENCLAQTGQYLWQHVHTNKQRRHFPFYQIKRPLNLSDLIVNVIAALNINLFYESFNIGLS